jgi:hypothetical protein
MAHFDPLLERNRHFATTGARMSAPGPRPSAREDS